MTFAPGFIALAVLAFLACAYVFTWALCKAASDSDDVWPELVDDEEWRP